MEIKRIGLICCFLPVVLAIWAMSAPAKRNISSQPVNLDELDVYNYAKTPIEDVKQLRVVAFNIEFGSKYDVIEQYLKEQLKYPGAVVFLLSEVDRLHSRTGDRHVARDLAETLGLNAVWGVEFAEHNDRTPETPGATGNAILSNVPLRNARIVRHTAMFDWKKIGRFTDEERDGQRMSLVADVVIGNDVVASVVSTHLESRTDGAGRAKQMKEIIKAIGGNPIPTIIGGDMNEQAHGALFDDIEAGGFFNAFPDNHDKTGDCIVKDNGQPSCMVKIDWIFYRGLDMTLSAVDSPMDKSGILMSDHTPVRAEFRLK